ncbi:S-layer-like domain-containing protein [Gottschalkia acidurici 9a]|uniref:S-layer-like domain-containing protein n=1 Tax=Gottschalkia acidurici (strain ATCC 7906 / DSM 604 / BCRC 14475 / CIP 104303 / KCTC 5404 / NCIMB 10678 / 9a) TaxID=1128398 RepID=K0AVJ1_GOTA9|nr:S-layer homology domain-containing protein [Gottschalkia acidurici]AFS77299.1 S-layer-like domain-containing protein [Gottschalkia acidurici 9a]
MYKKVSTLFIALTIVMNSILLPIEVMAKQEYRIEFFHQLAEGINSLYYKEVIVGLDVAHQIYGESELLDNISKELESNIEVKTYLESKGFTLDKIGEIIAFIDGEIPQLSDLDNEENLINSIIKTVLVDKEGSLDYLKYDDKIDTLAKNLYDIMPDEFKNTLDNHYEDEEEKIDVLIKIIVETIHSGYGVGFYDIYSREFKELKLQIKDELIQNINKSTKLELSNKDKEGVNLILKGLENTIRYKGLERVYSDICGVIGLIDIKPIVLQQEDSAVKGANSELNQEISRAELLEEIFKNSSIEFTKYQDEFIDVGEEDEYADYISTAKKLGLVNGYGDNTFRPESKVSRSEMAVVLSNVTKYKDSIINMSEQDIEKTLEVFKDKEDIEDWAKPHVARLIKLDILEGKSENEFDPKGKVTKGEAKAAIYRLFN